MASTDAKGYMKQLDDLLTDYLVKKAPALPGNVKDIIVRFAPWVTLILFILTLPILLAVLGLGAILTPFSFMGGVGAGTSYIITLVFSVIVLILEAMAIPGLFKRTKGAWNLLYYAALISAVQNLLTLNLGGLIIGGLISLYFLFQVKEYYK